MSANGRCPYCGSDKIERYKVIAWKCLTCGRVFYTPLAAKAATEEAASGAETVQEE